VGVVVNVTSVRVLPLLSAAANAVPPPEVAKFATVRTVRPLPAF
jgi:hypothetical protein